MKTYAQNKEDFFINNYMGDNFIGTLLSIGENDGVNLSNTKLFIEKGYEAILIEPSPVAYKKLESLYDGNKSVGLFNIAISDTCGTMPFWESGTHLNVGDTALLSTLNESELKRWEGSNNHFEKTEVEVWDFKKLMQESLLKTFDLISIDCEGNDIICLKQMDLKQLKCKALVIEWNGIEEVKKEIEDYVTFFTFKLYLQNAENLIFFK